MGKGFKFRNRNEARVLRDMARERLHSDKSRVHQPSDADFSKSFYLAVPYTRITAAEAAETPSGTKLKLGTGTARLFRRNEKPTALHFVDNNDGDALYLELSKVTEENSTSDQLTIRVYNPYMHEIGAEGSTTDVDYTSIILLVQQDAYGNYIITGEVDQPLIPCTSSGILSAGGNCKATLLTRPAGASTLFTSISRVVTVYDSMMNTGDFVPSGSKMWIKRIFGKWYMVVPVCSTSTSTIPPPVSPPAPPDPQPPPILPAPPSPPWLGPNFPAMMEPAPRGPVWFVPVAPCTYFSVETSPGVFAWSPNPLSGPCSGCSPPAPPPTGLGQSTTTTCGP